MPSSVKDIERIVRSAWLRLPASHRALLEAIGASQHSVVDEPIGAAVVALRMSAGLPGLSPEERVKLDGALGVWDAQTRSVLIDASHPLLVGLHGVALERFVARIAWHEWGHALSVARCSRDDIAAGRGLLAKSPPGVRSNIRAAGYRPSSYTHEVVAEIYAMLMERLVRDETGRPEWLDEQIYELVMRVTGWNE